MPTFSELFSSPEPRAVLLRGKRFPARPLSALALCELWNCFLEDAPPRTRVQLPGMAEPEIVDDFTDAAFLSRRRLTTLRRSAAELACACGYTTRDGKRPPDTRTGPEFRVYAEKAAVEWMENLSADDITKAHRAWTDRADVKTEPGDPADKGPSNAASPA